MATQAYDAPLPARRIDGPRMLMIGEFDSTNPSPYFVRALRAAGWHVTELDFANFFAKSGGDQVSRIVSRLMVSRSINALRAAIMEQVDVNDVDAVFFTKAVGATAAMLETLASRSIRSICWYPDFSFDHAIVDQASLPLFDLFITTKDFHLPFLNSFRDPASNVLIDHGYCDDIHWRADPPVPWDARRFDIAFIGNHSAHKQAVINGLIGSRPNLHYLVAGNRWTGTTWPQAARSVTMRPALSGDAMSRAFNDSRLAIAVHHGKDGNVHGWEDSISARTFEIPACGTAMVHIAGDYLPTIFAVPGETACFTDQTILAQQVDALLADPVGTMAMAERAYRRAVPDYGYLARGHAIAAAIARFDHRFAAPPSAAQIFPGDGCKD